MIKQNSINRNAQKYANPDLVGSLYQEYRIQKHDLDFARQKRNEHNSIVKHIVTIEDDLKRES